MNEMGETRRVGMKPTDEVDQDSGGISMAWLAAVLLRDRRIIIALTTLGLVASLIVALLRSTYYTVSFSFIPQSGQDAGRANGLASLAGQIGINIGSLSGQGQSPQLYADLLSTREILSKVADDTILDATGARVPLPSFVRAKGATPAIRAENTMRFLREKIIGSTVAARTTGMVTVSVRTKSPHASLTIAEQLLAALNQFNVATRKSQATEERRFTEGRLADSRESQRQAEDALQVFLQRNRQYAGSPELAFEKSRLEREVSLRQQVVTGLAQQYEDARIREVRDTPVITVLERPTLPVLPDPGGRAMAVVVGTFGAGALAIAIILGRAGWKRDQELDPDDPSRALLADELRTLRSRSRTS